jgi:hypothetical protein
MGNGPCVDHIYRATRDGKKNWSSSKPSTCEIIREDLSYRRRRHRRKDEEDEKRTWSQKNK